MPDKFKLLVVCAAPLGLANLLPAADDYLLLVFRWLFRDAAGVVAAHATEEM